MDMIYIDSLFLLNLLIDYLILTATARLCTVPLRRGRYLLSALLGAAWAAGTVLPGLGFLSAWPLKLAAAGLMALIAFGTERHPLRCFLAFLGVSFAFGGAVWAASMLGGTALPNHGPTPVTPRVLLLALALTYTAVTLVFRGLAQRSSRELVTVFLGLDGRSVTLRALHDTGNELSDPVTGGRVLVTTGTAAAPLLPPAAAQALAHTDALTVFQGILAGEEDFPDAVVLLLHGVASAVPEVEVAGEVHGFSGGSPLPVVPAVVGLMEAVEHMAVGEFPEGLTVFQDALSGVFQIGHPQLQIACVGLQNRIIFQNLQAHKISILSKCESFIMGGCHAYILLP